MIFLSWLVPEVADVFSLSPEIFCSLSTLYLQHGTPRLDTPKEVQGRSPLILSLEVDFLCLFIRTILLKASFCR